MVGFKEKKFYLEGKLVSGDRDKLDEIFDFLSSKEAQDKKVILNVEDVKFIDSSILGTLLILKEKADEKSVEFVLKKPQGEVLRLLELSKFDTLINIEK